MNPKFRGIWIPATVWFMFLNKEIGATELHLLATIDSLVTPEKGCYASNKYLGEILGVRPDYIARLISKLKHKDLIKQVKFDGRRRYLETVWSRVELDRLSSSELEDNPPPPSPLGKVKNKAHPAGGFGFEPEEEETTHHAPFDKAAALQLQTTLPPNKQKQRLPKTWPNHFRLLRTADNIPKEMIEAALDWYCENYRDQWTPKCYTAKIFRDKFDRVVAAMKRGQRDNPQITVTPEAEKVVERLLMAHWPKGAGQQLPAFVQVSLDGYGWFRDQVIQQAELIDPNTASEPQERMRLTRHRNLLRHLVDVLPAPSHFVETWFSNIWKRVNNWEAWSGNLAPLSFDVDSSEFEKYIAGLIVNYGQDAMEANKLLTGMDYEGSKA